MLLQVWKRDIIFAAGDTLLRLTGWVRMPGNGDFSETPKDKAVDLWRDTKGRMPSSGGDGLAGSGESIDHTVVVFIIFCRPFLYFISL